jgi:hypothetical protein
MRSVICIVFPDDFIDKVEHWEAYWEDEEVSKFVHDIPSGLRFNGLMMNDFVDFMLLNGRVVL